MRRQAAFTFFIDPGRRVYVRRVNIAGNELWAQLVHEAVLGTSAPAAPVGSAAGEAPSAASPEAGWGPSAAEVIVVAGGPDGTYQGAIAAAVGKDRASVANFQRLLRLPTEVQAEVAAGTLSMGKVLKLPSSAVPSAR